MLMVIFFAHFSMDFQWCFLSTDGPLFDMRSKPEQAGTEFWEFRECELY